MTNIMSDHLNLCLLQIQLLLYIIYLSISFNFGCTWENVDILRVHELEIAHVTILDIGHQIIRQQ